MGAFTFYLVATSWVTIRRKEGSVGFFEIGAFLVALGVAATCLTLGFLAVRVPTGKIGGLSYSGAFVLAAIWALAAAGDLKMILRRGVFGAQLIARHLWRMCVALLIAALSLFLGQPQLFPASVHKTGVLFVPEIAVVVLMIFWLIRVRFTNRFRHDAADHGAP